MSRKSIEFQYFEGCPNAISCLKNLREVTRELGISEDEISILKTDMDSAERNNFQGSPTILINGFDIYTDSKPGTFNYACRVYLFEGRQTGILPKEFIQKKIEKYIRNH